MILVNLSMIFDRPTGISNYALNIAKHLSTLNPILLSSQQQDNFSCYSIPSNMTPAEGSKGHFRRLLWTQWQLPQIYQKLNADLIYSPIPEAPLYSKARYVVMCHDLIPLRFPNLFSPLTNYFRYVVPSVLKQAEHIICNSEATAKDIHDFYGIAMSKITPILLAYDAEHFYPRERRKTSQPYFLYLGRHDPYKNIQGLIGAFAGLKNKQDYQLWIAGSFDERFTPQLQQQVLELDIQEEVKFIDYVSYEELPQIISDAISLVFPTFWEGFGLPALEAIACGTPVITSNLASLPEVVGDAAMLIDPHNQEEIASAMAEIGGDQGARSQLSNLSLERAKLFSWAKTGQATKEVLQQFI
ncbi:MAG: glycosyltransferase family 1 protein [Cyanobacteria bacterium P01_F01_bin.143]